MKILLIVLSFAALILTLSLVSASTELVIHVDNKGNAEFFGDTTESSLSLPSGITLLNGKIRGITNTLTSKTGETWSFSYSLIGAEIQIILPPNTIIKDTSGETSISRGNIVIYNTDSIQASYVLSNDTSTDILVYVVWALILVIVISAIIFGYRYIRRKIVPSTNRNAKRRENPKRIDIVRNILHERQRSIIDILKKEKKIKSSYLRKLCNMPKASFSRHIQELEKKNLIKRYGEGKNKIIELINK